MREKIRLLGLKKKLNSTQLAHEQKKNNNKNDKKHKSLEYPHCTVGEVR